MIRNEKIKGTLNVLADLGFKDAEEISAKLSLAIKLNRVIENRDLSQARAATITGMTQHKISQIRRYKIENLLLDRLMKALVKLDQDVAITVRPARGARRAGLSVAA
jgi:predicted XRE-type DNA-binding protein